jgi:hypothetical protein
MFSSSRLKSAARQGEIQGSIMCRGLPMLKSLLAGAAIAVALSSGASAQELLGSYVARISAADHHASDGYRLDTAAQMVRQDRANVHRYGRVDAEDDDDPWFRSADARARLEQMLNRNGAMDQRTRQAIVRGEPVVQVDVYRNRVIVRVLGN